MNKSLLLTLFCLISGLFFNGCTIVRHVEAEEGHYYINPSADYSSIGRVIVLELNNETSSDYQLASEMTESMREAIQKRHLFNVDTVYKSDAVWKKLAIGNGRNYTLEQMSVMRKALGADAVVYGVITRHYGYPHMLIGLHICMLDLRQGNIVWAMEQVWDSTDARTVERMHAFYDTVMRDSYNPMGHKMVYTSPRAFRGFVCYEVARTLPDMRGRSWRVSSENTRGFNINDVIFDKSQKISGEALKMADDVSTIHVTSD